MEFDRPHGARRQGDLVMPVEMVFLAQLVKAPSGAASTMLLKLGMVFLLFVGWAVVFLGPIVVWRLRVRQRGYPGLMAYLRELPRTDAEALDAVELTLKGAVICILGLLLPPVILVGLVPLYYGARKWAAVAMGITGAEDAGPKWPSE
jgi:hypothetical protein